MINIIWKTKRNGINYCNYDNIGLIPKGREQSYLVRLIYMWVFSLSKSIICCKPDPNEGFNDAIFAHQNIRMDYIKFRIMFYN